MDDLRPTKLGSIMLMRLMKSGACQLEVGHDFTDSECSFSPPASTNRLHSEHAQRLEREGWCVVD